MDKNNIGEDSSSGILRGDGDIAVRDDVATKGSGCSYPNMMVHTQGISINTLGNLKTETYGESWI